MHNFIIGHRRVRDEANVSAESLLADIQGVDEDEVYRNSVFGSAQVFLQNLHHTETDLMRDQRNFCGAKRDEVARKLYDLGHRRPRR